MSKGIFITGTGTDVGKTYISALILKKLHDAGFNCGYYKAAMSGNIYDKNGFLIPLDAGFVKDFSHISQELDTMCPYVYEAALSPHLASRLENNPIDHRVVTEQFATLCKQYDYITMEGSGGILCPLVFDESEKLWLWELVKELELSCLIVADAGLGTINDVGLTVSFMKETGISVKGIIFNHFHKGNIMEKDNIKMCEYLTGVKVIACVEDDTENLEMDARELASYYEEITYEK